MSTITNKQLIASDGKDWLANLKTLDDESWLYDPASIRQKIPSIERVTKLVDVLNPAETDAASYALIEILSAVQLLFIEHTHDELLEIEKMVWTAIDRAYLSTSHYKRSLNQCLVNSARCAKWRELTPKPKPTHRPKGKGK